MKNEPFAFFAQIEEVKKLSDVFEKFQKDHLYYYYFQKNKLYYLFLYGEKETDLVIKSVKIITELNTKKRKIRSLRGYILHVLSYIEDEKSIILLSTNFHPQFWARVKDVLKQNKKNGLLNFLFNVTENNQTSSPETSQLLQKIEYLQNEMLLLKKQIKILNSTDKSTDNVILDIEPVSDGERFDRSSLFHNSAQQQEFYSVGQLDEKTQEDIIREGFTLFRRDQITLKEYYEGTNSKHSLFNSRGFSIKYDTIRKSELYKKFNKYPHLTT